MHENEQQLRVYVIPVQANDCMLEQDNQSDKERVL